MSESFVGEIKMFAGNFAPLDWALCDGQLLSISQNEVLYSLIGTTYGGDGVTNFALPDMRGRIPIHQSPQYPIGQKSGTETVTPAADQIAAHSHTWQASTDAADTRAPGNGVLAKAVTNIYTNRLTSAPMNASAITQAGGNQPHDNVMPFLCINFIIALNGFYPTRD